MSPVFESLLSRRARAASSGNVSGSGGDNAECCDEPLPPPEQAAVELLARELPELPSVLLRPVPANEPARGGQP